MKTHVGRVLAKLSARDQVRPVIIAFETGLVTPAAVSHRHRRARLACHSSRAARPAVAAASSWV